MLEKTPSLLGISNKAGEIKIQNILSPLLWLCAVCVPAGCIGLLLTPTGPISLLFGALIGLPVLTSLVAFWYFAIKDPNRLQSESYRIQSEQLQIMSKQGGVITDPADLKLVNIDVPASIKSEGRDE